MLALSAECAPDAALGDMPLVYPFVVNDPGEGVQAKRRAHAVIVDHLVPPMMRADTYDELAELEALLDEYARLEVLDPLQAAGARRRDLGRDRARQPPVRPATSRSARTTSARSCEHIDGYLCEVKDIQIKDGLHILGQPPRGDQLRGLVRGHAAPRLGRRPRPAPRRRRRVRPGRARAGRGRGRAGDAGRGARAVLERFRGPAASAGDLVDRLEAAQMALLDALAARAWDAGAVAGGLPRRARPRATTASSARCASLRARSCPASAHDRRARARDRRAQRAARPRRSVGQPDARARRRPADRPQLLLRRSARAAVRALLGGRRSGSPTRCSTATARDTGELPRMVGLVAWGTSAMRTQGDDVAEILALIGVRPTWHPESRRVTGIEVIPLEELGRPRIDVTVRISGFFRDAFPHLVALLDDAVASGRRARRAGRPELRRRARARRRRAARRRARRRGAWRRRRTRVFGSKPGHLRRRAAAAGRRARLARRRRPRRRSTRPGAATPTAAASTARARARRRCATASRASRSPSRTSTPASTTSSTPTTTTSTTAAWSRRCARSPAASPPPTSATAPTPRASSRARLAEETRRVFRARVANPRWIASMIRHGYKGAAELSATVDYLFGYDATTGVAEDWMYEQVAAALPARRRRRRVHGPLEPVGRARDRRAAARGGRPRPVGAARGRHADAAIRDRYLALEGELEEAGA